MITTQLTVSDYLALENPIEGQREFVDGAILEMPPESNLNVMIAIALLAEFMKVVPVAWLRHKDTELTIANRVRMPDLMILGAELAEALAGKQRSTVTEEMPAPLLVVEVVSPGKTNADRDYRFKRSEYAARGIPEYWIVDPDLAKVSVLTLVAGWYEETEKRGEDRIDSPRFPELALTAAQVLLTNA